MYNLIIINQNVEEAEKLKAILSQKYYVKGVFPSIDRFLQVMPNKIIHYITIYCNGRLESVIPLMNSQFIMYNDLENDKLLFNAIQMGVTNFVHHSQKVSELIEIIALVTMGGCYVSNAILYKIFKYIKDVNEIILGKERNKYHSLSRREIIVLEQLLNGISYKEISSKLSISVETTRKHISRIYKKLNVHSKAELYDLHYNVDFESNQHNLLIG